MARREPRPSWRERLLGGRDSWRRVLLAGVAAGVVLAGVAAIAMSFATGGGGALDKSEPTAIAPGQGPGGPIDVPIDEPTLPPEVLPTEPLPTEPFVEPTEPPFVEPTATVERPPTEQPIPLPTEPLQGAGDTR